MNGKLFLGIWRVMVSVPRPLWQSLVEKQARQNVEGLGFMSEDHHRVRDFVVLEIPRAGEPLSPGHIAGALDLPLDRVQIILDELEKGMTFLFRNETGAVSWAYPVTTDRTPHRVTFDSGESAYAA